MYVSRKKTIVFLFSIFCMLPQLSSAANETELSPAMVNPGYVEKPAWFKVSCQI